MYKKFIITFYFILNFIKILAFSEEQVGDAIQEALKCPYVYQSVNVITGEYCESQTDLHLEALYPITLKRCYATLDPVTQGWRFNHPNILTARTEEVGDISDNQRIKYLKDEKNRLKEIYTTSSNGEKTYQRLFIHYSEREPLSCQVRTEDGKEISYYYSQEAKTHLSDSYLLERVITSDGKECLYQYCDHPRERRKLLIKREETEGRFVSNEYYDSCVNNVEGSLVKILDFNRDMRVGRVKLQKAPVGIDSTPIITGKFFYYPGYTEVFDALNHKTIYRYGSHNKLTAIENDSEQNLYRIERFFWDNQGRLISRAIENGLGEVLTCQTLAYDQKGNIIKHVLYGNLTGNRDISLVLEKDGQPLLKGVQNFSTFYQYSDEEKSKLLSYVDDSGRKVCYGYLSNSDQLVSILTCEGNSIQNRIFYFYDEEERLICVIRDDGKTESSENLEGVSERIITRFFIKENFPAFGMTERIEESYLDLTRGQEILIRKIEMEYSLSGKVTQKKIYDAEEKHCFSLSYDYDSAGNLIHAEENGKVVEAQYDSHGNQIYFNDNQKQVVSRYDFANRLIYTEEERKKDNLKMTATLRYDFLGNQLTKEDMFGNKIEYSYDDLGRLTTITYPQVLTEQDKLVRPIEKREYDCLDRIISTTDCNGFTTNTRYNIRGKPIEIVYPDGTKELFEYFCDGSLAKSTTKEGTYTVYHRDYLTRPIKEETFSTDGTLINSTIKTYNAFHILSESDLEGNITQYSYDGAGRLMKKTLTTQSASYRSEFLYDSLGYLSGQKKWFENGEESYTHICAERDLSGLIGAICIKNHNDDLLKKIEVINDKTAISTNYRYDGRNSQNQAVLQRWDTDSYGVVTIITFDTLGREHIISKRNSFGVPIAETENRYDFVGNKIKEINKVFVRGHQTDERINKWIYSPGYRLEKMIEAAGTAIQSVTAFTYFSNGKLENIIKPDGVNLNYEYTSSGQVKRFFCSNGDFDYTFLYDSKGRVVQANDRKDSSLTLRTYNEIGNLTSESLSNGNFLTAKYDLQGRRTCLNLPDESAIVYHYNAAYLNSVERLGINGEQKYIHTYISRQLPGQITSAKMIGELGEIFYNYDDKQKCIHIQSPYWSEEIKYDDQGKIETISIKDPIGPFDCSFRYDELKRIAEEKGHCVNHYVYDSIENRINKNQNSYEINALNQIVKAGDTEYIYDVNGNLIETKNSSSSQVHYRYDGLNRLVTVSQNKNFYVTFTYDPFHRRTSKISYKWDQTADEWTLDRSYKYLYDGNNEIGVVDETGKIVELRVLGTGLGAEIGSAISYEIDDRIFAPIHDHRGSVVCLVDAESKNPIECYRYNAYGEVKTYSLESYPTNNYWKFCSKRTDCETDLVFFGKRYYAPSLGRWLTKDPLGAPEGINRYAYALNQPLTRLDLYGLYSISEFFNDAIDSFKAIYEFTHEIINTMGSYVSLSLSPAINQIGEETLGWAMWRMAGFPLGQLESGVHGKGEINDKVRVTFINGILNARIDFKKTISKVSECHGGNNIHYVLDASKGWAQDILKAFLAKLGYVSPQAYKLADTWKQLIQEMGGIESGGLIIHYAHSVGSLHSYEALRLLTSEERRMITVYTFGAPHLHSAENIYNFVSLRDGVCLLDPLGLIKGLLGLNDNTFLVGTWNGLPIIDHLLESETYFTILRALGEEFLDRFLLS
jgi:RHS repeat-associated protein